MDNPTPHKEESRECSIHCNSSGNGKNATFENIIKHPHRHSHNGKGPIVTMRNMANNIEQQELLTHVNSLVNSPGGNRPYWAQNGAKWCKMAQTCAILCNHAQTRVDCIHNLCTGGMLIDTAEVSKVKKYEKFTMRETKVKHE